MKDFFKTIYFGVISFLPAAILSSTIFLLLATLALVSMENAILDLSYYSSMKTWSKYLGMLPSHPFSLVFYYFLPLFLFTSIIAFKTALKIVNKSFNFANIKSFKLYTHILVKFAVSYLALTFAMNIVSEIFSGFSYLFFVPLIFTITSYSLFIIYWHYDGYIGDLISIKEKSSIKDKEMLKSLFDILKKNKKIFLKVFAVYILIKIHQTFYLTYAVKQFSILAWVSPESQLYPFSLFAYNMVFGIAGGILILLPLIYLFFNKLHETRIKASRLVAVLLFFVIGFISFSLNVNKYKEIGIDEFFYDKTGIQKSSEDYYNTIIVFGDEKEIIPYKAESFWTIREKRETKSESGGLIESYNRISEMYNIQGNNDIADNYIPCDQETINKIKSVEDYLEEKKYKVIFADEYFDTLSLCNRFNGYFEDYVSLNKRYFEESNSLISGLIYAGARTFGSEYDESYLSEYLDLINSSKYHIGENTAKNIIKKLLLYNQFDEANKWIEEYNFDEKDFDFTEIPFDGKIEGQMDLGGLKGRVVLLNIDKEKYSGVTISSSVSSLLNKRMVASSGLSNDGYFSFNKVRRGEYALGLILYGVNEDDYIIRNDIDFGKINIEEGNLDINLGLISVN